MTESDPSKNRFSEPAKFLPVAFILSQIGGLWTVYIVYHCLPRLQNHDTYAQARTEMIVFNAAAVMMLICYVKSILTHPGTIPEVQVDGTTWDFTPQDRASGSDAFGVGLHETKRSGERRHCKWCAKYKPDRCHHCRVCRMCILKMDHHCPWIYNCVGFGNHKFFFLLLFYAVIASHIITWTMAGTLKESVDAETPFFTMFFLLFGETLAGFLAILVTCFWGFHIWLMLKSMTTIEFCEKSMKRTSYDISVYDRGTSGSIRAVLGDNPAFWLLPICPPSGDGLTFASTEETPLRLSKDIEVGSDARKTERASHKKSKAAAGTGECGGSESESSGERRLDSPRRDPLLPSDHGGSSGT